jgi:hypothetical protein
MSDCEYVRKTRMEVKGAIGSSFFMADPGCGKADRLWTEIETKAEVLWEGKKSC